ncbi:hypothetical protein ECEC1850_4876, partial [Escherichia coli EC1850]
PRCRWLHRRE